jgi:hypothetical protein
MTNDRATAERMTEAHGHVRTLFDRLLDLRGHLQD